MEALQPRELALLSILYTIIRIKKQPIDKYYDQIAQLIEKFSNDSSFAVAACGLRIAKVALKLLKEPQKVNITQILCDRLSEALQSNKNTQLIKGMFSVIKTYVKSLEQEHFNFIIEDHLLGELSANLRLSITINQIEHIIMSLNFLDCIFNIS